MAYTKIFAIRRRLDRTVAYAVQPEKTEMENKIAYAIDEEKTRQPAFTTALNCESVETAYQKMAATKERWDKTDGVLGYHLIQSFAPGEVTPEQAHAIGVEFAKRMFGERYEVVIGTHLDQAHTHNHIVINAVSFQDGKRYHSSPESYYGEIRAASDALCREHQLSVITPQEHGKAYAEWKAEKAGKPTLRSMIRADIDSVIENAYSFETFLLLLEKRGYRVVNSSKRKYITVKPPGAKRAFRLDSLGAGYTEAEIQKKIKENRQKPIPLGTMQAKKKRYYRIRGKLPKKPRKKITGFLALYFRYVYFLRANRGKPMISAGIKGEVLKLERYQRQFQYLLENNIQTNEQLEEAMKGLEREIVQLEEKRTPLYRKKKAAKEPNEAQQLSQDIGQYTDTLREKRKELNFCRKIYESIPYVIEQYQQAQTDRQKKTTKGVKRYEFQRGNR